MGNNTEVLLNAPFIRFFHFWFLKAIILVLFLIGLLESSSEAGICKIDNTDTPQLFKRVFSSECTESEATISAKEILNAVENKKSIHIQTN
jgi:hypothetical protein